MKMLLSPRRVQVTDTLAQDEASIECKFLGHHDQNLVVPIAPPPPPKKVLVSLLLPSLLDGERFLGVYQKDDDAADANHDDGVAFRMEIEQKDAPFWKCITNTDDAFEFEIAKSNTRNRNTNNYSTNSNNALVNRSLMVDFDRLMDGWMD
jgi:hypothetical protein